MAKKRIRKTIKGNISDLIDDAFSEFESLAEEMRSWADAIEEKFSTTEKYERINEAADTLEGISRPDVDDNIGELEVEYVEPKKLTSRSKRNDHACYLLQVCIDALAERDDDESSSLKDELDSALSDAEGVYFPGMYG